MLRLWQWTILSEQIWIFDFQLWKKTVNGNNFNIFLAIQTIVVFFFVSNNMSITFYCRQNINLPNVKPFELLLFCLDRNNDWTHLRDVPRKSKTERVSDIDIANIILSQNWILKLKLKNVKYKTMISCVCVSPENEIVPAPGSCEIVSDQLSTLMWSKLRPKNRLPADTRLGAN